jgi:hypothetical protein
MAFYLGAPQLGLHRLASKDDTRYALTGIHIDPERGVAAASDGKCLVEIAASAIKKFPTREHKLANGEAKPFVLAAKSAQALAKMLAKGKTPDDPAQCAALAATKPGQPPSFLVTDGKTVRAVPVETVDGQFPDYHSGSVFPNQEPLATMIVNAGLLRDLLGVAALSEAVTLHILKDRLVVLSQKRDGPTCRAVVMGIAGTAMEYAPSTSKPSAPAKTAPEPHPVDDLPPDSDTEEDEADDVEPDGKDTPVESNVPTEATASAPASEPAENDDAEVETGRPSAPARATFRRHRGGYRRPYRRPTGDVQPATGPSPAQRAFHTFLIRSRGGDVTAEDLSADDVSARIDALKADPEVGELVATWPQWRKLFLLLVDRKATPQETCEILNGLTDIQSTSSAIAEQLSAVSPAKAAA